MNTTNDTTFLNNETNSVENTEMNNSAASSAKDKSHIKRTVIGSTSAGAIGLGAAVMLGTTQDPHIYGTEENNNELADLNTTENTHDDIYDVNESSQNEARTHLMAEKVNDAMSFPEAFSTAREEIGIGGIFIWHGGIYATYTAEEWNCMSESERNKFQNDFAFNHKLSKNRNTTVSHVHDNQNTYTHISENMVETVNNHPDSEATIDETPLMDDDIEIIHISHETNEIGTGPLNNIELQSPTSLDPQEVEILGVMQSKDLSPIIDASQIDGSDVVLIDVNSDIEIDLMNVDENNNENIDGGTVIDFYNPPLNFADNSTTDSLCGASENLSETDNNISSIEEIYEG